VKGRGVEVRLMYEEKSGGCTFAWIAMAKAYGYWDVSEGRWWRIEVAVLGI